MLPPLRSTRTITLTELQGPGCYLLHHVAPYMGRPSAPIQHYLGYSRCIGRCITEHAQGRGAHCTCVVYLAGIAFEGVAIWPGATCTDERELKRRHHHAKLCPLCCGAGAGQEAGAQ